MFFYNQEYEELLEQQKKVRNGVTARDPLQTVLAAAG